ncbi:MocR-like pyridoxine biosynthesis transcription factor PdxR [Falsibacillus albus]|uniref:PLP-dependent aminotransferase family protein n=1 Tax=Falsibacillus albus TaxID=2478915 RepID=A0A3L7KA21_9BACI|nr:PLP-dependent aminotransferase family protein [Falsibacillus albus]RLQ97502.1 PLP-dependent aminotransferase family protein [Falsibacillus albus]
MEKTIMLPPIIFKEGQALYDQLYTHIRDEITSGSIPPGSKLPSIRKLSTQLNISKTTVEHAYGQLLAEGYTVSREKSGIYVEKIDTSFFRGIQHEDDAGSPIAPPDTGVKYDFHYSRINHDSFPLKDFERAQKWAFSQFEHFQYGDHFGYAPLRRMLSVYLRNTRGVQSNPEQIIIGSGTRYLISLLVHLLDLTTEEVGYENPGFDGVREYLKWAGVPIAPIQVDEDGISLEKLTHINPKVVYTTPAHQFPTGAIMPIKRRVELLQWANEQSAYIFEDDFDGEFRYSGRPIPSLQSLDKQERVIYLGSFSKALTPALRISFMVLPPHLLKRLQRNERSIGQTSSTIMQAALYHFINEGFWHRHLNRVRNEYVKRYYLLHTELQRGFPENSKVIATDAGFHMLLKLPGMNEDQIVDHALKRGVKVYPTAAYWEGNEKAPRDTILLGFGGLNERDLSAGIAILRDVVKELKA